MTPNAQSIESGHTDVVHDVQMDYYGKRIASCSSDKIIKVFSITGDQHTHLADLAGKLNYLRFETLSAASLFCMTEPWYTIFGPNAEYTCIVMHPTVAHFCT